MAQIIPPKVNPGDLITATYMDQIIDALTGLDQRVSKLEATGSVTSPVRIDGFTATPPVRVGDTIEVDGAGFIDPATLNQVTMVNQVTGDTVQITSFAMMSGPTKLIFQVPAIPNLADAGTAVKVTVTNANGTATSPQILIQPVNVVPKGQTQVLYTNPPVMPFGQQNITPGQSYIFTFTITANTTRNVNYSVTPTITGAGWSAQLVETTPIAMAQGATQPIHIQVTAAAGAGTLSLSVVDTTPNTQVTPGYRELSISANSPPPTPDNRVRVTLVQVGAGASIVGGIVQFKRGQSGAVQFKIIFTDVGLFSFSPTMRAATGWHLDSIDISSFQVNPPTPVSQGVNVFFTAGAGAGNTDLLFTVTRGTDLTVTYALPVTVVG